MSLSSFTVVQQDIQAALQQIKPDEAITSNHKFTLSADQSVQQPFSKELQCSICLDVVLKPKICSECEKLYCGECIDEWTAENQACPHCKKCFTAGKMSRIVSNILDDAEFRCNIVGCNAVFFYQNALLHFSTHLQYRQCILNCGSQDLIVGHAGMREHVL